MQLVAEHRHGQDDRLHARGAKLGAREGRDPGREFMPLERADRDRVPILRELLGQNGLPQIAADQGERSGWFHKKSPLRHRMPGVPGG